MIRKFTFILALLCCVAFGNNVMAQAKTTGKVPAKKQATKTIYTKDPATGVEYHFYKHDKNGKKPVMGDFVSVVMVYGTEGDSVIFDSHKKGGDSLGSVRLNLRKTFNGCLEEGIAMMSIGDSAAFKMSVDSMFLKSFHMRGVPPQVKSYKYFIFHIKLLKVQTEQEVMDEMKKAQGEKAEKEQSIITKYLKDSNIHVTPNADGMYIISHTTTTGKAVEDGDSVYAKYVGKLLNGSIFDQSAAHGGVPGFANINGAPALAMVYSKNMPLIKGWVMMLGTMHEGEKVTILLPSSLAYGDRGAGGQIGPFTPLLFDLEVVKVKANK